MEEELEFLLSHASRYLTKDPTPSDVLSVFAGLRPLVKDKESGNTSSISRDHTIYISSSGLVTVAGGKWTTYRKMAEDTIDHAATIAQLPESPCVSRNIHIHGYHRHAEKFGDLALYGSDAPAIKDLLYHDPALETPITPNTKTISGEVVWAVRREMARTVEDFLSRRTRTLLLDARESMKMAPAVAAIMAKELQKDDSWAAGQVEKYTALARGYLIA